MMVGNPKACDHERGADTKDDTGDAADGADDQRLGVELQQDVGHARARRHANADLSGSLGDAHEHDVHDADAADQQRNRRHRPQEHRERALGLLGRLQDRRGVADLEVYRPVSFLQQIRDRVLGGVDLVGVSYLDGDRADVALTEQTSVAGRERRDRDVVHVVAERVGALRLQQADHLERHVVDQDVAADRITAVGEQVLGHGLAEDDDWCVALDVFVADEAAAGDVPIVRDGEARPCPLDGGLVVDIADPQRHPRCALRHRRCDVGERGDGGGVGVDQRGHVSGDADAGRARPDDQHIGAHGGDPVEHLLLAAVADRQHGHDRGDADDDAEQRQDGAEEVRPQRPQRHLHGLGNVGQQPLAPPRRHVDRAGLLRRTDQLAAVLDDAPVANLDMPIGMGGDGGIVRDQHDGAAVGVQLAQQCQHLLAALTVEGTCRLVGENHLGVVHQRARDGYALLLPARELAGSMCRARSPSPRRCSSACARAVRSRQERPA